MKPSDIFEGEDSGLKKAFDGATREELRERVENLRVTLPNGFNNAPYNQAIDDVLGILKDNKE